MTKLFPLKIIEGDKAEIAKVLDRSQEVRRNMVGTSTCCRYDPFLIYPTILLIKSLGIDRYYITLRTTSIIYGVLRVWLLYLFLGRWFSREAGLIAAFILATSSWFIGFCRLFHDYSVTIWFSLMCCYFYSLSDRPRNPLGYMALGVMMSLSGCFYFPGRVVIPIFLFAILIRVFTERGYFKTYNQSLILMVFSFFLGLYLQGIKINELFGLGHSSCEWFWVRYGFHPHDCATPWEYLITIFKFAYNRFFVQWGWFWDPVCERDACLDPITRYIFLVGIVWSLVKIKDHRYRFLLIWFAAAAAPTLITQTWFRRSILVLPALAALSAVGIWRTLSFLTGWIRMEKVRKVILFVLISAILVPIARLNLKHYFGLYQQERYTRTLLLERQRREKFIELLKKYRVYTDIFHSEYGWPQSGEFEAKRFGREDHYKPGPASRIRSQFDADPGPCALILKSGKVEIKEGKKVSPPPGS